MFFHALSIVLAVTMYLVTECHGAVAAYGQCGGQDYVGETSCVTGYTCISSNQWYSQCVPSTVAQTENTPSATTSASVDASSPFPRATYTEITNFGTNPTSVRAWLYVPQSLVAKPPIIVGIHWCHGDANAFYTGTNFKSLADQKGFIMIYPQTKNSDGCWDVHTNETLTHDAGGDSLGIVSAVRWTISNFGADTSRVFAVGTSSGAMMTNVLIGAYPDIFAAGSANAGVPFACFQGVDSWNSACAAGTNIKTAAEWGNLVRAAYPGYTGQRPKMQFWHGTADQTLNYNNFKEEVKQWTNVMGVDANPTNTVNNYAVSGWTRYDYGPKVMGISAAGVSHDIQLQSAQVMEWFGF